MNYTQAVATCSAAQQYSTFTVQILYKLYSLQLNCTYSNYTAAATFQLHNSTADVLCKFCTNCTIHSWTILTTITHKLSLYVPLHNTTQSLQLMPSPVQSSLLFHITPVSVRTHSVMSLDRTVQVNATAWNINVTCSQHHKTIPTAFRFETACVHW
jgi:hypothetical protein